MGPPAEHGHGLRLKNAHRPCNVSKLATQHFKKQPVGPAMRGQVRARPRYWGGVSRRRPDVNLFRKRRLVVKAVLASFTLLGLTRTRTFLFPTSPGA